MAERIDREGFSSTTFEDSSTTELDGRPTEAIEELAGAVGKWVSLQRAECNRVHAMERAPHARLREQQQVPSGEIDGFVGGVFVGCRVS